MKPSASATLVCSVMLAALALAIDAQAAQGLSQVRDKWIGQSAGRLIAQHGYPDNVIETQEGRKVYAYVKTKRRLYSVPIYVPPTTHETDIYQPNTGTYSYGVTNSPGTWVFEYRTRETRCTGYFEIDARQTIVAVQFKGEDCPN